MTLFESWANFWTVLGSSSVPIFMWLFMAGLLVVIFIIPYLILKELLVYGRKVPIQIFGIAIVFEFIYISVFLWILSGLTGI